MAETYKEHSATVTVNAPVHEVYSLFTHFNDFPKFMSFVKEVTYANDQTSHWVADVVGHHEWDAVNEGWIPDRQIGWHATKGMDNFGKVTFEPTSSNQTKVNVFINYDPPAGVLGDIGEKTGAGKRFDTVLQKDMNNFAEMVNQAPAGALDPTSSNYLFHTDSAASKGTTTGRQNETMYNDPNQSRKGPVNSPMMDRDITGRSNQDIIPNRDADIGSRPIETRPTNPPLSDKDRDTLGY